MCVQVLELLPADTELHEIHRFLGTVVQEKTNKRRKTHLLKSLLLAEHLQVKGCRHQIILSILRVLLSLLGSLCIFFNIYAGQYVVAVVVVCCCCCFCCFMLLFLSCFFCYFVVFFFN